MATVNTPRGLPVIARLSATAVLVMSTAVLSSGAPSHDVSAAGSAESTSVCALLPFWPGCPR